MHSKGLETTDVEDESDFHSPWEERINRLKESITSVEERGSKQSSP